MNGHPGEQTPEGNDQRLGGPDGPDGPDAPDSFIPLYEAIEQAARQAGLFADLNEHLASALPPPAPGLAIERDWWLVWQKLENERQQWAKPGLLGGGETPEASVAAHDAMQQWWRNQLPYTLTLMSELVLVLGQLAELTAHIQGLLHQQMHWQPPMTQQQQEP